MSRNPLIPFALIAALGIVLMVVLGFIGVDNAKEIASGEHGEKKQEEAAADPEELVKKSCTSCHGQNLEGANGPKLNDIGSRLSAEEIQDIIINGKGSGMPGGLVSPANAEAIAGWLAEQK